MDSTRLARHSRSVPRTKLLWNRSGFGKWLSQSMKLQPVGTRCLVWIRVRPSSSTKGRGFIPCPKTPSALSSLTRVFSHKGGIAHRHTQLCMCTHPHMLHTHTHTHTCILLLHLHYLLYHKILQCCTRDKCCRDNSTISRVSTKAFKCFPWDGEHKLWRHMRMKVWIYEMDLFRKSCW